ncbi:hypothetical protein EJ04DRAFT_512155 [Polyplosphaeria fusca]|uniref:Glycosyl transferase CAP10 domain-containing protein n=1 Tax=Polyplosphaeria fusca TaxID=682080 RepID=A0A9P4V019_9PLEO|nr:hypothetical protein EJ04DRAFT_512155 [Polyplosphaeria fusca]
MLLFRENDHVFARRNGGLHPQAPVTASSNEFKSTAEKEDVFDRLSMSEKECKVAFPELTRDITDAVGRGKFTFEKSDPEYKGLVQGRIKGGKLYILTTAPDTTPEILHQRTAILHQISRALSTAPSALPDTHFAFVINDSPKNNSWAFARPNKPSPYNIWLMPSFAFWSWPTPTLGTIDDVLSRIASIEHTTPFTAKIDKAAWRGTAWFNPLGYPRLRHDLLLASKNKSWADIQKLESVQGKPANALPIHDFCKYKYVVYTEGVTYSGRLPYHQACASVLITAPLTYLTTTAWSIRPIYAEALMQGHAKVEQSKTRKTLELLPSVADWRDANAVYVAPDFSNLEIVVEFLQAHPEVAERIARNQRETVVGGGYLSPAAETCYWRALIRGWAGIARASEGWGDVRGERFETWILKEVVQRREGTLGKSSGPGAPG